MSNDEGKVDHLRMELPINLLETDSAFMYFMFLNKTVKTGHCDPQLLQEVPRKHQKEQVNGPIISFMTAVNCRLEELSDERSVHQILQTSHHQKTFQTKNLI